MKKYTIIRIYEPDFGCEGLPDGDVLKDDVVVKDESGNVITMQIPDAMLYSIDIDEGDTFFICDDGKIVKEKQC